MKTLYRILFSLLVILLVTFILGQDIVNCSVFEKVKTENTACNAGALSDCSSDCANEEEITFFLQIHSDQILPGECQNIALPAFNLPPVVSYPVWLPPDNS